MFTTDRTVHDPALLQQAQRDLMHCESYKSMQDLLLDLIQKNDTWRTKKCINLVAAESPMSRLARSLLACDLSMRTAGGHIGKKSEFHGNPIH